MADNGESTFTQIRSHLQEQHNIKSTKDVKLHLHDLEADNRLALIEKIPHGNGNANSYRIRKGFSSLKRLYNFLNENGAVRELMQTSYFKTFTASPEFFIMVKANLLVNAMLDLYSSITDEEGYSKLTTQLDEISAADRKSIGEWMNKIKDNDRSDPLSGKFLFMLDVVRSGNLDLIIKAGRAFMEWNGITDAQIVLNLFGDLMPELIIPENQGETVSAILRFSPGAFDYMLNSKNSNALFPTNLFLGYFCSQLLTINAGHPETDDNRIPGRRPFDFKAYKKYETLLPRYSPEPPIILIARSLFVADMIHGKLTVDEIPEETLRIIFSHVNYPTPNSSPNSQPTTHKQHPY